MHGQCREASARMKHNITELLHLMNLIRKYTRNEYLQGRCSSILCETITLVFSSTDMLSKDRFQL